MHEHFVYLLESQKDQQFYIGQTNNLKGRLEKHNAGQVKSTAKRIPFKLIGFVKLPSRKEALGLEKTLKSHSDKKLKFIKKFKPDFKWQMPR